VCAESEKHLLAVLYMEKMRARFSTSGDKIETTSIYWVF